MPQDYFGIGNGSQQALAQLLAAGRDASARENIAKTAAKSQDLATMLQNVEALGGAPAFRQTIRGREEFAGADPAVMERVQGLDFQKIEEAIRRQQADTGLVNSQSYATRNDSNVRGASVANQKAIALAELALKDKLGSGELQLNRDKATAEAANTANLETLPSRQDPLINAAYGTRNTEGGAAPADGIIGVIQQIMGTTPQPSGGTRDPNLNKISQQQTRGREQQLAKGDIELDAGRQAANTKKTSDNLAITKTLMSDPANAAAAGGTVIQDNLSRQGQKKLRELSDERGWLERTYDWVMNNEDSYQNPNIKSGITDVDKQGKRAKLPSGKTGVVHEAQTDDGQRIFMAIADDGTVELYDESMNIIGKGIEP